MKLYKATIRPITAFSSPIQGDTLFGYMCWEYLNAFGEDELNTLLSDYYTPPQGIDWETRPPFVVSDALPSGFLPRPNVPLSLLTNTDSVDNIKALKKSRHVPRSVLCEPLNQWGDEITDILQDYHYTHSYSTVNRKTSLIMGNYNQKLIQYPDKTHFDIYFCIDTGLINVWTVEYLLSVVGTMGYGALKSRGLGKFTLESFEEDKFDYNTSSNAYLTLACHYPEPDTYTDNSYYKTTSKFGKHGDVGALSKQAYKSPVLLCTTGAVMTPEKMDKDRLYIGMGLGGNGELSGSIAKTVHQAYAPVVPIIAHISDQQDKP